jgi:hypothetical protein
MGVAWGGPELAALSYEVSTANISLHFPFPHLF